ncbi:L-serine ammonia-lyase [Candidatus Endomicrobiellum devescovinae]|jgi:L-serine dehydratase|uniref:L-serine ammonia-lyase n=1 Tax=Candidatus Endomicrobiellum devescovinae TaxID=3242322 RepID=UPI0028346897|nr:L-serine ammonia-lyase [Endomicrobium sp.]MDR1434335.1 L-serine ammonia-lyase [Endomicrobium sp.]MDR2818855.1 L-serine ammonia-lyase [Endomicrobium sp.]
MSTKNLDKIINMSVFDLLKTGPGPSSSHTIAPMKAGYDFVQRIRTLDANTLAKVNGVRVRLYGSLSATGKGHGTDKAVIAGLMGNEPSTCQPTLLNALCKLPKEKKVLDLGEKKLPIGLNNIAYCSVAHNFPYNNTLVIDLLSKRYSNKSKTIATDELDSLEKNIIFSWEYYSVGGGFLQWKGWTAPKTVKVPHPYSNMTELITLAEKKGLSLDEVILQNEIAISGLSKNEVNSKLNNLIKIMKDTVARGIATEGVLPGPIGLKRKAKRLKDRSDSLQTPDRYICLLDAYAYAVAEENAAGNTIVTTPTCGASGVIPSVLMIMQDHLNLNSVAQRKGLLVAAAIGFIAKTNAGISGAEVGCQGEIGVATAMAAAMIAHAQGYSAKVVENAAEIALEHQLGLTCDPVGGYVQIPCIERNAIGAVKACNAALIATNELPNTHKVTFDTTVNAMREIGKDMSCKLKETAMGGLAVCMVYC